MDGGAVGVAVDELPDAVGLHRLDDRLRGDVHDRLGLALGRHAAAFARLLGECRALGQRAGQEARLPPRVAHLPAEGLVFEVLCAQGIAVHEQRGLPIEIYDGRIG